MDKKGILRRLFIVLAVGLLLLGSVNVWAGLVTQGSAHFQDPDFWINGHEPPSPFSMDQMLIEWWVYQRDSEGLGPASIASLVPDTANFVTTFRITNEADSVPNLGLSSIAFQNVSLEPMPTAFSLEGVGVVDDSAYHNMVGFAQPMDPLINPYGGALVTFSFNQLLQAGMYTDLGWMASLVGPETLNAGAEISWSNSNGDTDVIEVPSIFGLDPDYTMPPVPEPTTLLLLGSGLLLSGLLRRKIVV